MANYLTGQLVGSEIHGFHTLQGTTHSFSDHVNSQVSFSLVQASGSVKFENLILVLSLPFFPFR